MASEWDEKTSSYPPSLAEHSQVLSKTGFAQSTCFQNGAEKGPGALEPAGAPTLHHTASYPNDHRLMQDEKVDLTSETSCKVIESGNIPNFEKPSQGVDAWFPTAQHPSIAKTISHPTLQPMRSGRGQSLNNESASQPGEASLHRHLSNPNDRFDYPEGGYQAYLIVFGAFSGMFAAFGFMNTIGTLQAYISTHQLAAYDESSVGWIFSLYIFFAFFGGIQVGPAFDQWGPKGLVAGGSVLLVAGELGLANSTAYWHFIINLSVLCGLGTTLIFTPCISTIAHWFCRRRATMTGFAATGGSVSGVLFPMLLPTLFEGMGWTWALRLMALVSLVACCISLCLLSARLPPKRGTSVLPDFTIFRNLAFTFTTGGVFAMEWGLFVPLTFISSWALDAGLGSAPHSSTFPFQILAILNGSSFFGRWLPGIAADRWGRFNTLAASMAVSLVFLVAVWLPAILLPGGGGDVAPVDGAMPYDSTRTGLAILFAIGFGFFFGAGISLTPVCVGELCDPREYGRWYATCYSIVSFGCLTGVPIAGVVLGDGGTKGWASLVAWTSACYAMSLACFVAARITKGGWRLLSAV